MLAPQWHCHVNSGIDRWNHCIGVTAFHPCHAVWLYHQFTLSFRDVEDLLFERGITVSREAIRSWCRKFGPASARTPRRLQGQLGHIWHVDELFITYPRRTSLSLESGGAGRRRPGYLGHTPPRQQSRKRFIRKVLKHQGWHPGNSLPASFEAIQRPTERSSHPSPIEPAWEPS